MNETTFLLPTEISIRSAHWSFDREGEIVTDLADIAQSLDNLWNTPVGSDILRPNYGCEWWKYIDYPVDLAALYMIRELILATNRWEPRVMIQRITPSIDLSHIKFHTQYQLKPHIAGVSERSYNLIIEGHHGRDK